MSDSPASELKPWHWIESDHWELQFEGLPRRIPWFDRDKTPPLQSYNNPIGNDFPIQHLYHPVKAMLESEPSPPPDPRFAEFLCRMERGNELVAAFENGDFIAAAGVLREMNRVSRPCGSLLFNEAYLSKRNGDAEGAREIYRRITEMCPEVEMTWRNYGELCEQTGQKEEAIRAYHEARRILPNHEQATLGLERLGAMVRLSDRENPDRVHFVTKEELRALQEEDVAKHWEDSNVLRVIGGEILQQKFFPDVALRALTRVVELDPENAEGQRNLAVALRIHGRVDEAINHLFDVLKKDRRDTWALFHLAECYLAANDVERGWETLDHLVRADPNHKPALELFFLGRKDQDQNQNEAELEEFSKPEPERKFAGSWQGYLLVANRAWNRRERERAVRLAAEAYKIAPEVEDVFFTYTGMLTQSGEYEWVAALTKPRLREGEKNPVAFHNFATALYAMGLHDEAIVTVRRACDQLTLQPEHRAALTDLLDDWTGRFAYSEIEVETQDNARESLRRNIYQVADGKPAILLFETGMGFPQRREIPCEFKKPRSEFDFSVEQRNANDDPEQTSLGTFTVREIDPANLTNEKVRIILHLNEQAQLGLGAFQGERKLGVTWSLVPPPRHESAEL